MSDDINSQPQTLDSVLQSFLHQARTLDLPAIRSWLKNGLVFTGCGTTYALAMSAAALYRRQGIFSYALPASEISFYDETIPPGISTLAAFSRSGETSETLWAVNAFRQKRPGAKVIAITANPDSTLAHSADLVIGSASARDNSVVETKSFTSMLLVALAFSAWLADQPPRIEVLSSISGYMARLMPGMKEKAELIGRDQSITRFFFLGGGPFYGAACQSAFTMKECTGEWTEAFHPLEFRHGPRTSAVKGSFVCLFVPDFEKAAHEELRVLEEMKAQGAQVLAVGDKKMDSAAKLFPEENILEMRSGLGDAERTFLCLPFVQWLAYFRALANGQDPDHPANLHAVTRL